MEDNENALALKARAAVAMRAGDVSTAVKCLSRAVTLGAADAETSLQLAAVCRRAGDLPRAIEAAAAAVRAEPRGLIGLLMLASLHEAVGSVDRATRFYREALRTVPAGTSIPPVIDRQIRRARQRVAESDAWVKSAFDWPRTVATESVSPDERSRIDGFRDSILKNAAADANLPSAFLIPDLESVAFSDPATFAGVDAIGRSTDVILREFHALIEAESLPVLVEAAAAERSRSDPAHSPEPSGRWSMIALIAGSRTNDRFARHCPETMRLFEHVDSPAIASISPGLYFSVLEPRTRIPPHSGISNARLIVHWPLIVPPSCGIRVGGETRHWRIGEPLIFDDMTEHEAWNDSDEVRVVLIGDVWRPELTAFERESITEMMALSPVAEL